jgi:hypothetical protein
VTRRKKNLRFGGGWPAGGASNQEVRAAQPEEPRPTSSARYKDKKNWCRGKIGGKRHEDYLAIRISSWARSLRWYTEGQPICNRSEWNERYWNCHHEQFCTNCDKIVQHSLGNRCPDFTTEITRFKRRNE